MRHNQSFKMRRLLARELGEVVALELACGLSTGGVERFQRLLSNPRSILLVGAPASHWAGDADRPETMEETCAKAGQCDGGAPFSIIGLFSGTVVVDEFQIDNLAIREGFRQRGLGTALVELGLKIAAGMGAVSAILEVRASNNAAQRLYGKCGFDVVGHRAKYYHDPIEDALILRRWLGVGSR